MYDRANDIAIAGYVYFLNERFCQGEERGLGLDGLGGLESLVAKPLNRLNLLNLQKEARLLLYCSIKNGPPVETGALLTIACHMKNFKVRKPLS